MRPFCGDTCCPYWPPTPPLTIGEYLPWSPPFTKIDCRFCSVKWWWVMLFSTSVKFGAERLAAAKSKNCCCCCRLVTAMEKPAPPKGPWLAWKSWANGDTWGDDRMAPSDETRCGGAIGGEICDLSAHTLEGDSWASSLMLDCRRGPELGAPNVKNSLIE